MSAATLIESVTLPCGCRADEVCHSVACHDDNQAVCGADVADATWCTDEDNCGAPPCPVCEDLANAEEFEQFCSCPCCLDVPS